MKNNLLGLILLFLIIGQGLTGQNRYRQGKGMQKVIDTCNLLISYRYQFYLDTAKKQVRYDIKYLEFGKVHSRYHSYPAEQMDSLARQIHSKGISAYNARKELKWDSALAPGWEDIYLNYPNKGESLVTALILNYEYCYLESIEEMTWDISPNTKEILGYTCNLAITTFRGRTYQVWFTPEIPVKSGPWKFNNLPGLILKAEDSEGFFLWEAVSISKPENRVICFTQGPRLKKMDREGYNRIRRMTWEDPVGLYAYQGITYKIRTPQGNNKELKPGEVSLPPLPLLERNSN